MKTLRYYLHEWHMRWKIRRILAYNRKHFEECFSLEDEVNKLKMEPATPKPLTIAEIRELYRGDSAL